MRGGGYGVVRGGGVVPAIEQYVDPIMKVLAMFTCQDKC
jgi:hypothetical protein